MGKQYVYGQVTALEEEKYGSWAMIERELAYLRKTLWERLKGGLPPLYLKTANKIVRTKFTEERMVKLTKKIFYPEIIRIYSEDIFNKWREING